MNTIKIEDMNKANAVNAPANQPEIKAEAENTSKDTVESTQEQTAKPAVKHIVVYIGNSTHTDSTGHKWHKNSECTYSDEEYEARTDLHFMVKYGEMKHTAVTM